MLAVVEKLLFILLFFSYFSFSLFPSAIFSSAFFSTAIFFKYSFYDPSHWFDWSLENVVILIPNSTKRLLIRNYRSIVHTHFQACDIRKIIHDKTLFKGVIYSL